MFEPETPNRRGEVVSNFLFQRIETSALADQDTIRRLAGGAPDRVRKFEADGQAAAATGGRRGFRAVAKRVFIIQSVAGCYTLKVWGDIAEFAGESINISLTAHIAFMAVVGER